jgi:hypothetical protein
MNKYVLLLSHRSNSLTKAAYMEGLARPAWWPCCSPPMPSSSSANTIWRKTALFWLPLQEIVRLQVEKDVLDRTSTATQRWLMTHLTNSLNFGSQSLLDSSAAVIEGDAFLAAIASAPSPVATIKERHDNEKLLPMYSGHCKPRPHLFGW